MSHQFYDFKTLEKGSHQMVQIIKQLYSDSDSKRLVSPPVTPGFLREVFPEQPPEEGINIMSVIQQTKEKIYPGILLWQSPRFFGYFPSTIAVTNVLAEMFATTFHSPAFTFALSPSHTEIQNIVVDWIVKALGIPTKFLLQSEGGGIINGSATESTLVSVHVAKYRKMQQINYKENLEKIVKFVGYYAEFSFFGNQRALKLKQIFHYKPIPVYQCQETQNFELDIAKFQQIVQKDVENGLIPFWYGCTCGTTFSTANDLNQQVIRICKKYGMWIQVDAAYLGSSWFCPDLRPNMELFEHVDSLTFNFSKSMFMGNGGNLFYIADKRQLNRSMGKEIEYSFLKNQHSSKMDAIDYKDWSFGLLRRNNSLKFFYLFRYFGLQKLRAYVRSIVERAELLELLVKDSGLFKMFCKPKYGLVCFQLCDKTGKVNNQLTRALGQKIKNIPEGFSSPGHFKDYWIIRIAIGNHSSTEEIIQKYFSKIVEAAEEILKETE